ncbi:MAG: site-specific integrase [Phycisphaerae bacterium]|nr:site-specific integrase [Phycisphaerae bacterium]
MARVFRHTYTKKGLDGQRVQHQTKKWYIEYRDAQRVVRRVPGFVDKRATEQRAAELERQAERERVGIVEVPIRHLQASLQEHIDAWFDDLARAGRASEYRRKLKARIDRLADELGWATLVRVTPDALARWLAKAKRDGLSDRTVNHYLDTANAFLNWCVTTRRLESNPIEHLARAELVEPTFERRGARPDECMRLLKHAPPHRRIVYLTAMLTGLRRKELKCLRWSDIHFGGDTPHIQLRAVTTKSRRSDTIPLSPELAQELQEIRPANFGLTDTVFRSVPKIDTFKNDLEKSGISYVDEAGRRLDFHALRVTFGSMLAASGTALRTAMELMRHTDARLTTRIYTDPRLLDTAAAINALPRLVPSSDDREVDQKRATGTDDIAASVAGSKSNCDQDCDPESLVSGLVFSLSERGSSIGNRLASDGTETGENEQIGKGVTPSKKGTYDIIQHSVAPPDTPTKKPAKRRAKVEAGGIEIVAENREKPRS